jgi:hypothetical protein
MLEFTSGEAVPNMLEINQSYMLPPDLNLLYSENPLRSVISGSISMVPSSLYSYIDINSTKFAYQVLANQWCWSMVNQRHMIIGTNKEETGREILDDYVQSLLRLAKRTHRG